MNTRYLEKKNNLEKHDALIKFEEENHLYTCFNPFIMEWVISKREHGGIKAIQSGTEFLNQFFISVDFKALAMKLWNNPEKRIEMENDSTSKYFGCKSCKDIEKIWSQGAKDGTKMHAVYEDLSNLCAYEIDNVDKPIEKVFRDVTDFPEKRYFFEYLDFFGIEKGEHEFYRSELKFYDPVLHLSGTADTILYRPSDNTYVITDFKRCKSALKRDPQNPRQKDVSKLGASSRGRFLPSFINTRNNSCNKYGLQLTLYKHLFERMNPDKKVSGLFIVVVNSSKLGDDDSLEIIEIPLNKFDKHIEEAFRYRAEEMLGSSHKYLPMKWNDALGKELYISSIIDDQAMENDEI